MNHIDKAPFSMPLDRSFLWAEYGGEEKTTEGVAP
jgi:hypothetical protein